LRGERTRCVIASDHEFREVAVADFGLMVGFGWPVRGREQKAAKVFDEAVGLWTQLQESGQIESWDAVFLEPHGGDLGGFFVLWGERDAIAAVRASDDFLRLSSRAQMVVENYGVVGAERGARIESQMGLFLQSSAELA
jgi:hypothetical protein